MKKTNKKKKKQQQDEEREILKMKNNGCGSYSEWRKHEATIQTWDEFIDGVND